MTTPAVQGHPAPSVHTAQPWTVSAFLSLLLYLAWLPLMFALGYLLGSLFGYEPGMNEQVGFWALAANVVVALLVIPLPSWLGAGLAVKSRRLGGGTAATIALVLCLLVGLVLVVVSLPFNGV